MPLRLLLRKDRIRYQANFLGRAKLGLGSAVIDVQFELATRAATTPAAAAGTILEFCTRSTLHTHPNTRALHASYALFLFALDANLPPTHVDDRGIRTKAQSGGWREVLAVDSASIERRLLRGDAALEKVREQELRVVGLDRNPAIRQGAGFKMLLNQAANYAATAAIILEAGKGGERQSEG